MNALNLEFDDEIVGRCVEIPLTSASEEAQSAALAWPAALDQDVVYQCLRDYCMNTKWTMPKPCAVCGRSKHGAEVETVQAGNLFALANDRLDFEHSSLPAEYKELFDFDEKNFKGKVLDRRGLFKLDGVLRGKCVWECMSPLRRGKKPKLSLANRLFRGELPNEFKDITWIEETVCSLIWPTAIVTRLYGSHDKHDPRVLRGNTCAHPMNVSSTIRVLPRIPSDVCGMLSVVFIGRASLSEAHKRRMFRVRKEKVWRFLIWLKEIQRLV